MAHYEIIQTPGKEKVYPLQKGETRFGNTLEEDDSPLKSQDDCNVVMASLRAQARADGQKVDFVPKRLNPSGERVGNGAQGTSVRLSEDNRRRVAMFCGRLMAETGDPITMGDAVAKLVDLADEVDALLTGGRLDEDKLITEAKRISRERKAARDAA